MTALAEAHPIASEALSARGVSIGFGEGDKRRLILDNVSLDVGSQEIVCVIGPSGCGKTTLLRALAGLHRPSRGEVTFHGDPVTAPRRELAFVFQDYGKALLPWRTVFHNVALALEARDMPRSRYRERIMPLLAQLGLERYADHFPSQLSGGLQQRVQIARCLAQEPVALLMDEPFGSLDAMTRQGLQDELMRIATQNRNTIVFVTHDLEEAIYLGDRVVALAPNPGRVTEIVEITLPRPRDQLTTREDKRFLSYRHHLYRLIQSMIR
jgi:NitT/TauT family transport system ATP-binding protein